MQKIPIVIAIVCVDWRMHHPDSNFKKNLYKHLNAEKIYFITYPGPNGLCGDDESTKKRQSLQTAIMATRDVIAEHGGVSVPKVLVAHSHCAGHSVDDGQHCIDCVRTTTIFNDELGYKEPFTSLIAQRRDSDYDWEIRNL